MVSFFNSRSRKRDSYQGFSKYTDELNRYQRPAVQPASNSYGDPQRSQSLTNGAGQAALAALRMHSPSLQQQQQQPQQPSGIRRTPQPRRANSLVTAPRSNSLRTYTYQPKASYIPGQANINNNPNKSQPLAKRSAGSLSSRTSAYAKSPVIQHYDENEEESIIITTKTTKVVDSQGRTQSITTETIKTLPDGSNIIEKTTKNISRSNSRTNSLRNNSILSASNPGYNLTKIEEDLQDFDYSYQIDGPHNLESNLKLHNGEPSLGPPIQEEFSSFNKNERAGSLLSENNLKRTTSSDSSPSKPLKSILKHRSVETSEFRDDPVADPETPTTNSHPYKNLTTSDATNLQPKSKVPSIPSPSNQSQVKNNILKQLGSPATARSSTKNDDLGSFRSANSPPGSIKFSPEVETIPIYSHGKPNTPAQPKYKQLESEEKLKLSNQELYAKALLVAQERVYGNKTSVTQPASAPTVESPVSNTIVEEQPKRTLSLVSNMSSLVDNKIKRDKKLDDYNKVGVEDRYKYENHHKDFAVHSFRNSDENPKPSSRKERAKEEKRLFKQQKLEAEKEKEHEKQLKKEEEKQRKEEEKLKKEETKKKRKSSGRGLFGRKKKDEISAPLEVAGVTAAGAVVGAGAIVASTAGDVSDAAHLQSPSVPQSSFSGPIHQREPAHVENPIVPQSSFSEPIHQQEAVHQNQLKSDPAHAEEIAPVRNPAPALEKETVPEQEPSSKEAYTSEDIVHRMPSPNIIPESEVTLPETEQAVVDASSTPVLVGSETVPPSTPPSHTFEPPQNVSRQAPDSPSTSNYKEPIEKPVLNTVIPEVEGDARSGDYATDEDTDIDDTEDTNTVQGESGVVRETPKIKPEDFDLSGTPTPVHEGDNEIPDRIHPVIAKEKLGGATTPVDYPDETIELGPDDVPVEAIEVGPVESKYEDPSTKLPTIIAGLDGSPIVLESGDKSSSFDETGNSYENKEDKIMNKKSILSHKQDELNELEQGMDGESELEHSPGVAQVSERIESQQPDVDNVPVRYNEQETQSYGGKYSEGLPTDGPKTKAPSDATASSADEPPEVDSHPSELEKKPSVSSKITGKKYNKFKHKLFKYFLNTYDK